MQLWDAKLSNSRLILQLSALSNSDYLRTTSVGSHAASNQSWILRPYARLNQTPWKTTHAPQIRPHSHQRGRLRTLYVDRNRLLGAATVANS